MLILKLFITFAIALNVYILGNYYLQHDNLNESKPKKQFERLHLVNIYTRHGDRAPTGKMPLGDKHVQDMRFFWPRGTDNLTEAGLHRMYRLGISLRQHYEKLGYLDYEPDSIIAFTSNVFRARESLMQTLKGFYDTTHNLDYGHRLAEEYNRLNRRVQVPNGSGSSAVWTKIKLDNETVASLDYNYFDFQSKYNLNHPSVNMIDLRLDEDMRKLTNINKFQQFLAKRYKLPFDYYITGPWTAIECELVIERTNETIDYIDHYADWIDEPIVKDSDSDQVITYYELFEVITLYCFITYGVRDPNADYLMVGPIINSIIESQSVALGQEIQNERAKKYLNKNIIFYSGHDSIMSSMLYDLGLIYVDGSTFAKRMFEAKKARKNDLDLYLEGLKMCNMALSLKFELWTIKPYEFAGGQGIPVVRLGIYNKPDPYFDPIEWVPVKLGAACRRRYKELNPGFTKTPEEYYITTNNNYNGVKLDLEYDCPFELFKNISSKYHLNDTYYRLLYNDEL